jgi:3-methylfumaryl-CoA hydratase
VTLEEILVPGPAIGLAGVIGLNGSDIKDGWTLPPLWHWVYLFDRPPQSDIAEDGHSRLGVPTPPSGGLRRMIAGGRLKTIHPLELGSTATSELQVIRRQERAGRSGPFTLVTVERTISQAGRVCLLEEQDVAYLTRRASNPRKAGSQASAPAPHVAPGGAQRAFEIDNTVLFRFSALTFNAHRIHYDSDYARDVEGYADLIVHGPLQALLMSEWARHNYEADVNFRAVTMSYRLTSPLMLGQGLVLSCDRDGGVINAAVRDATGRITATSIIRS